MNDARPVWLTEEEAKSGAYSWLYDLWLAAPADATEAAMRAWDNSAYPHTIIAAVLRALGMPGA